MMPAMNSENVLVEVLDRLKGLRIPANMVESNSKFQLGWRDLQDINEILVSGFIFQLDVAVSDRLPYLNQTLDRVGVQILISFFFCMMLISYIQGDPDGTNATESNPRGTESAMASRRAKVQEGDRRVAD